MARRPAKPRRFRPPELRAWREFYGQTIGRKVTLEWLAGYLEERGFGPVTHASLSRIERGRQPYSPELLNALAELYNTTPGALLDINPLTLPADARELLKLPPDQQAAAFRIYIAARTAA